MKNFIFFLIIILYNSCNLNTKSPLSNISIIDKEKKETFATYCNPLDIDYTYMVYNSGKNISYRSGADPEVIEFKGVYYLFMTRSFGYWYSTDLIKWNFIKPLQWYFEGSNAPTAFNYKDSIVYFAGNPAGYGSIIFSNDPKIGKWEPIESITDNIQDSELFIDEDGDTYLYWGSSNLFPIKGKKLNRKDRFQEIENEFELIKLNELEHGWEQFGENNFHPKIKEGYIEGASMTKHNNRYYLQYAAPGTQFNVYADGVYVGLSPKGPFSYQKNNPMSFKPGGFLNGAGHGSTLKQFNGQYWHFATSALSSNSHWERRICMYPTYFDEDNFMYTNTNYGDYPHYGPNHPTSAGLHNGWMLLSYKGITTVSSSKKQIVKFTSNDDEVDFKEFSIKKSNENEIITELLTDENSKSFWVAESNDESEWVKIEMLKPGNIHSIQINFHDYETGIYSRKNNLYHRFTVEVSEDGLKWNKIIDKSKSNKDSPNAYLVLDKPIFSKYVRYNNIKVPGNNFALTEIRVFGLGEGKIPKTVENFSTFRQKDRREIKLNWNSVKDAQGYNIKWGIDPNKFYHSWLVYDKNELYMRNLDKETSYYFLIEAFNENGISEKSEIIFVN